MKIVNICTYDNGGAGRAAVRINESLNLVGEEAVLLVRNKKTQYPRAVEFCDNSMKRFYAKCIGALDEMISHNEIMYEEFGIDISKHPIVKEADVLILHWTNHFISYRGLKRLIKLNKPIIWVMHDMWLLTGGCHFDDYCGKYKAGCPKCTLIPNKYKSKDKTKISFHKKMTIINNSDICIVTPSEWLLESANESTILEKCHKKVIFNPLNTDVFIKMDNIDKIKEKYGVSTSKKIIAFGAYKALHSKRKGYQYLLNACKYLPNDVYELVLYGSDDKEKFATIPLDVKTIGVLENDKEVVEIMNIADVVVAPSEQDNYSNVVLEALACGTPVVAFKIGGMPSLIDHKRNGYLCEFKNCIELSEGIKYCADNSDVLGEYAFEKVRRENSFKVIGEQYKELCENIIK